MRGRKLIAAALLAGMVASPMVMAEVLSDDALGSVSAQGFQTARQGVGADVQNMNNDAVQLNDQAQQNAAGLAVTNSASGATNVGQNIAGVMDSSERDAIVQTNDQYAYNRERSILRGRQIDVDVTLFALGILADVQNMNNGSVQLNDDAQSDIQALVVTNTANSAANVGQNIAGLTNSVAYGLRDDIVQRNTQVAENKGGALQRARETDVDISIVALSVDFDRQNVNNGSTQLNDNAQTNAAGLALTNSAGSAVNVAQNIVGVVDSRLDRIVQTNDQYARNERFNQQRSRQTDVDAQIIAISIDVARQNMNNGSVQLNDNAQQNAVGLAITNVASSAANVAQNIAGLSGAETGGLPDDLIQRSNQVAINDMRNNQGGTQVDIDINAPGISVNVDKQNINNASVQLNDNAQQSVAGLAITNVASSALNVAQNIAGIVDSHGDDVVQTNNQEATDYSYNVQAAANVNVDYTVGGFSINFGTDNVNNASVQLNDNAQQFATGLAITNAAGSAVNVGQNIAGMVNGYSGSLIQTNIQSAMNY